MPEKLPLAYQQEWLRALLLEATDWNCTLASGWRLKGQLDLVALQRSLTHLLQEHGALRTRFILDKPMPMQEVLEPSQIQLSPTPVDGSSPAEIHAKATALYEKLAAHQFNITAKPPLELVLLELAANEHWLLLAIHRLLVDCSSVDRIFSELWRTYHAMTAQEPVQTSAALSYGQYALAQRQGQEKWEQKHGAYWTARLDGASHLHWPITDSPSIPTNTALGRMSCEFDLELSAALRDLARRTRSLPGNVVLTVYIAVLWAWCRQDSFVVPFSVAARQSEHRNIVGFFSHILYLRMQLNGTETFSELIGRVSNEFYRALSHQDFGIMATRRPDLLRGTFVQWITWHPDAEPAFAGPDLAVERLTVRDFEEDLTAIPPGMVDVEVTFFDAEDGIHALGCYRADRFTAAAMDRFMDDLRATAEQIVRNPQIRVVDLSLSTAADSHPEVKAVS